jgi:L-fuconolactonase
VGWVDLTRPRAIPEQVAAYRAAPGGAALVGIRHLVQDEPDPGWLLREPVHRSLEELGRAGLVYDLVVRPEQLPAVLETVRAHPGTRFVVDHLAKPRIARGDRDPEWEAAMRPLSQLPNVWCKLSGLVTEAAWDGWTVDRLRPYVERACAWFGDDRLLFGSDWPVCTLAASYRQVLDAAQELIAGADASVRARIMGLNAVALYGL